MCDEYCCNHGCNQGRNCPVRMERVRQAKKMLNSEARFDRLRRRIQNDGQRGAGMYRQMERAVWILIFSVIGLAVIAAKVGA